MDQCRDVLHKLKRGMVVRLFDNRNGGDLGLFIFEHQVDELTIQVVEQRSGSICPGCINLLGVQFLECDHEYKRIKLFRTDEFHCTKCPHVRPFDIEKDEAA